MYRIRVLYQILRVCNNTPNDEVPGTPRCGLVDKHSQFCCLLLVEDTFTIPNAVHFEMQWYDMWYVICHIIRLSQVLYHYFRDVDEFADDTR